MLTDTQNSDAFILNCSLYSENCVMLSQLLFTCSGDPKYEILYVNCSKTIVFPKESQNKCRTCMSQKLLEISIKVLITQGVFENILLTTEVLRSDKSLMIPNVTLKTAKTFFFSKKSFLLSKN